MKYSLWPDWSEPFPYSTFLQTLRTPYFCAAFAFFGASSSALAFSDYDQGHRDGPSAHDTHADWNRTHKNHYFARDRDCRDANRGHYANHADMREDGGCRSDRDRDIDLDKESGANPQQTPFDDYLRRQAARENRWNHQARDAVSPQSRESDRFKPHDHFFRERVDFGNPDF